MNDEFGRRLRRLPVPPEPVAPDKAGDDEPRSEDDEPDHPIFLSW